VNSTRLSVCVCVCPVPRCDWLSLGGGPASHPSVPWLPSRFVQILVHFYKSPVIQVKGEHRRTVGRKAVPEVAGRHGPQSQTLECARQTWRRLQR
jgi:hypothetical protein